MNKAGIRKYGGDEPQVLEVHRSFIDDIARLPSAPNEPGQVVIAEFPQLRTVQLANGIGEVLTRQALRLANGFLHQAKLTRFFKHGFHKFPVRLVPERGIPTTNTGWGPIAP